MKIRTSIIAASIAAAGMFSGCSDSSLGSQTFGVNLTAVDGYVVKLNTKASASCTSTVSGDTKMFYSAAGINTPNGVIPFAIQETYTDCSFTIPADAILDSNGNGVYDMSADTNAVGFAMARKANVSAEVEDVLVTPLTTYVEARRVANNPVTPALEAVINAFNVMNSLTTLAGDNTTASYADAIQLATFQNAITTTLSTTNSTAVITAISTTTLEADLLSNNATPNVTDMFSGVTGFTTTAIENDVSATVSVLEIISSIAAADETVDLLELYTKVVDADENLTVALAASAPEGDFTALATELGNIEDAIAIAETALDTFIATLPANLSLGDTLRLGTTDISLSTSGEFNTTVTVNSSTTVADFSKIVLPNASINKWFADQNVTMEARIVNQADSTDVLTAKFGNGANRITLAPNDANTSVKTTIYTSTPITMMVDIDGVNTIDYDITAGVDTTNTDLTFDACDFVDCTDSVFDDINTNLQVTGKVYDVNITIKHIVDTNLTTDYKSIIGTITTN